MVSIMLDTTRWPPAAGAGRKTSGSPRRMRKRRDSKVVYQAHNSRCSPPRNVRPSSSSGLNYTTFEDVNLPLRTTDAQQRAQAGMEFYTPSNNGNAGLGYTPIIHQENGSGSQIESGNSWQQQNASLIPYTLANTNGSSPPQFFDSNIVNPNATSPQNSYFLHISGNAPWNGGNNAHSELEDLSMLDIPYGNYDGSLGQSPPTTAGTSSSDGFAFPLIDSALGSAQDAGQLFDLDLSGR